ncbi:hypothetical protein ACJMK2_021088 [Sinanodonta woodiana]|uniref:Biotin-protein ligase N-terminal domain-containing protein n=1 Tax=Sinanodonta woodiana TaxID=1069815 RepID=A0ABD3U2U2_SINWO
MDEVACGQHIQMKNILRNCGQKISQISRAWVYVYKGEGADDVAAETLLHGLRHYLDPMAYSFGYITPESIREGSWKNQTALLALGGGYDLGFINALGNDGMKHIKDYVTYTGGAYLGICAGAYFACDHIEFDKGGPLEVVGERQFKFFPGCCRGPTFPGFDYKSRRGAVASKVLYQNSPGEGAMHLNLYFNGGGTFIPPCDSFSTLKNGFIHDSVSSTMSKEADISLCHKIYLADDTVTQPDRTEFTQNLLNLKMHNNFHPQQLEDWDQLQRNVISSSIQLCQNDIQKNGKSHISHNSSDSSICCDEIDKLTENPDLESKCNKINFVEVKDVKLGSVGRESAQRSSLTQDPDLEHCSEKDASHHELTLTRNYEILGCYAELAQQPACIVKCIVGKGTALLSSVHFEYSFCDLDAEDAYLVDIIPKLKESEIHRQALFISLQERPESEFTLGDFQKQKLEEIYEIELNLKRDFWLCSVSVDGLLERFRTNLLSQILAYLNQTARFKTSLDLFDQTARFKTSLGLSDQIARFKTSLDLSDQTARFKTSLDLSDQTARFKTSLGLSDQIARFKTSLDLSDQIARFKTSLDLSDQTARFKTSLGLSDQTARFKTSLGLSDQTARFKTSLGLSDQTARVKTGGTDNCGVPVVTFPGQGTPHLLRYDTREVGQLVSLYLEMCGGTASFLVDLQHGATPDIITRLAGTLEYLEIQRRGSVRAVYIIKPKSRAKLRFLKKCMGSHKESGFHYTVVLLKNQRSLFYYIHSSSLTWDFGGTLQYNHEAWVIFQKMVVEAVEGAADVLKTFPDARDKISLLQELDTIDMEAADINNLIEDIQLKYKTLVGNNGVHEVIDLVKQTIHKLEKPDEDAVFSQIHATLISEAIGKLRRAHAELSSVLSELESLKDKIDSALRSEASFRNCVECAKKIQIRILSDFWPQLVHHPYVANTVSQAEIYRTHFTASILQPAKEMLLDATQLLLDMKDLISRDHGKQNKTAQVAAKLSEAVQPFVRQLNRLNDTYTNIHVFHVVFEKCKSWYKNTLGSITSYMFSENNEQAWKRLKLTHVKKHPPPRSDHMAILDEHLPTVLDSSLQEEATLLCHRVKFLLELLKQDFISDKEVSQIRAWEEDQMFLNADDINEVTDSREDLSQLKIDNDNLCLQDVSLIYQSVPLNHEYDQCDEYNMIHERDIQICGTSLSPHFQDYEAGHKNMNYETLEEVAVKRQTPNQYTDKGSSRDFSNTCLASRQVSTLKAPQSKIHSLPRSPSSSDLGYHDDERFIDLSYSALDADASTDGTFTNYDYFLPEQCGAIDTTGTFLSNRKITSNIQSNSAGNTDVTFTMKGGPKPQTSTLLRKEKLSTQFEEHDPISSPKTPFSPDLSDSSEDESCPTARDVLKKKLSGSFSYDPNVSDLDSYMQHCEKINAAEKCTRSLTQGNTSANELYMPGDIREAQHSSVANHMHFSPQSKNESEMISMGISNTERLQKRNAWNNVECMSLRTSGSASLTHKGDSREQRNASDPKQINDRNKDLNSSHSSRKSNMLSLHENVEREISKTHQINTCQLSHSAESRRTKICTAPLQSEHPQVPSTYGTDGVFSKDRNAHLHVSHNEHFTDNKLRRVNETKSALSISADETKNENVDLPLLVRKLRNKLSKSLYDLNEDELCLNDQLSYRLSRSLFAMSAIGESILTKAKESNRTYFKFEEEIPFDHEYDQMSECQSPLFAEDTNGQLWFTGSRKTSSCRSWNHANNEVTGVFYENGKHKCNGYTIENPTMKERNGQHSNPNEELSPDKGKTDKNDHIEEEIARKLELLRIGVTCIRPK